MLDCEDGSAERRDPFYEAQEKSMLIGVANLFLEALFHDVSLDYHTPIISQQGEVAGRLQVLFLPMFLKFIRMSIQIL